MVRYLRDQIDPRWAWAPYEPDAERPWDLRLAGHVYRRAGFGATYQELQEALRAGPKATIDRLLQGGDGQEAFDRECQTMAEAIQAQADDLPLRAWWLYVMLHTPHPLREKMTLFWHNHFATSQAKVLNVAYMLRQNQLLRQHALGRFGPLLQAISKDPAMLIWLDTVESKKGKPNENYARELMELFSLGIGHYTEADIRQAARAFTGWEIKQDRFFFNRTQHDATSKTVFGQSGPLIGEDVVRLCLQQTACASFLARKLFRYFISETLAPDADLIEPLAKAFRDSDYDVMLIVETMLRSNLFFSDHAYRARVKSPTEFGVGLVRSLNGKVGTIGLAQAMENLGQKLFFPPSVKGWDGGTQWLHSTTLLQRQNLAQAITSTEDQRFGRRCDPAQLIKQQRVPEQDDAAVVQFFVDLFLQNDLPEEARQRLTLYRRESAKHRYPPFWTEEDVREHRLRTLAYLVISQPEYQLD